jgi:Enoyl-CoA hydratase/carnithine racemase
MDYTKILFEEKNGVAIITLNDPKNLNTMIGNPMIREVTQCLGECDTNPAVKVIVIKGAGMCFSAGGDVKIMKKVAEEHILDYRKEAIEGGKLILKIREVSKPVIASTHGNCVGGGLTIAAACDFRISTEDCTFMVAFANVGLVPDMGASFLLTQILGPARAAELIMTAKPFKGTQAYEWGLVNQIVPSDQLEEATMKLANKLANGPGLVYEGTKELINNISYVGLKDTIIFEAEIQYRIGLSEDHKESVNAFLEKRKANLVGC